MTLSSILWRRLDTPGHDACRLEGVDAGWKLDGTAVFREDGSPAWLTYHVVCDRAWRTLHGQVSGWLRGKCVEFTMERTDQGIWTLNGAAQPGLENCVDLDFSFTPATNLPQIRRIALATGQAADVPAAWLDAAAATLTLLPQRYERRSVTTYWYQAPSLNYAGLLEVCSTGFIRRYPGLWEAEP